MSKQDGRTSNGGARPGAGRHRWVIRIGKEAARALHNLTLQRRMIRPAVTEDEIVTELIEAAWSEQDQEYQQAEEETA